MADWAKLHNDLLFEIGKHVTSIEDYNSFGAVCKSWKSAAPRNQNHLKLKTLTSPIFILPQKGSSKSTKILDYFTTLMGGKSQTDMREFYSVSTGKTSKFYLPEATNKYCLSWKDWLFTFKEDGTQTTLLHIVSRFQIHLPNLSLNPNTIPPHSLVKFVSSANPNLTSDFKVIILLQNQLYFYKLGNNAWTEIDNTEPVTLMMCKNNCLYTYDNTSSITIWDFNGPNMTILQKIHGNLTVESPMKQSPLPYLESRNMFEFSNKFYRVIKYSVLVEFHRDPLSFIHRTKCILVYEAIIEDGKLLWRETKDLGNKAIFYSKSSFMVECSEINNCKPNCVYFSDDTPYHLVEVRGDGQDMGIYHLSNGRVEAYFDEKIEWSKFFEPMWIEPSF